LPGITEVDEEEEKSAGIYNVPGGDMITQLYTSSGDLLDLTYRAGKLYDSHDNLVTNLYKVTRFLAKNRPTVDESLFNHVTKPPTFSTEISGTERTVNSTTRTAL